ncbi:MAG: hypothetical protein QM778_32660 [Myxococcales bacterium]
MLSDALALTVTTSGLLGQVEVGVLGWKPRFGARLAEGALRVTAHAPPSIPAPDALRLRLASPTLGFAQLARFLQGEPLRVRDVPSDPVKLLRGETLLAEGALIVQRGEIGVRVSRVC